MAVIDTAMRTLHLVFGGLWTGSVVLFVFGVIPSISDADRLAAIADREVKLSRLSVLVTFLTGGHLAGTYYTVGELFGSTRGYLVLFMLLLWVVLAALVEIGTGRLRDGNVDAGATLYRAGGVVALALLLVGGLLAGGVA
jgi:hypothetical protein